VAGLPVEQLRYLTYPEVDFSVFAPQGLHTTHLTFFLPLRNYSQGHRHRVGVGAKHPHCWQPTAVCRQIWGILLLCLKQWM